MWELMDDLVQLDDSLYCNVESATRCAINRARLRLCHLDGSEKVDHFKGCIEMTANAAVVRREESGKAGVKRFFIVYFLFIHSFSRISVG